MKEIKIDSAENILGRTPAEIERLAIADGFLPTFRIGDEVQGNHGADGGRVDSLVLFQVSEGYVWACRFEGGVMYFPQDHLQKVASRAEP